MDVARSSVLVAHEIRVYPVKLVLYSLSEQEKATVPVGFGLVLEKSKQLVYLRIQSHLRHMGLGRRAIRAFIKKGIGSVYSWDFQCRDEAIVLHNGQVERLRTDEIEDQASREKGDLCIVVTAEQVRRFHLLFESVERMEAAVGPRVSNIERI